MYRTNLKTVAGSSAQGSPANFDEVSKVIDSIFDVNTSTIIIRDEKRQDLLKQRNN
ncbi:MAG: hypothetical protein Q4B68_08145 [Bacteroidales bacterium]|nr:hypothetical protein [Bacteroidales bacterium]